MGIDVGTAPGLPYRVCTDCDGLSPYDSRFCIGCGKYLPSDGSTRRLPVEGPTQTMSTTSSEQFVTAISAQVTGDWLPTTIDFGMSNCGWSLGASGLYWREVTILEPDEHGNLVERKVTMGFRMR